MENLLILNKTRNIKNVNYNSLHKQNYSALDFHHKDNSKKGKDREIGILIHMYSKKRLFEELKNCKLLCSNCHRELHNKHLTKLSSSSSQGLPTSQVGNVSANLTESIRI